MGGLGTELTVLATQSAPGTENTAQLQIRSNALSSDPIGPGQEFACGQSQQRLKMQCLCIHMRMILPRSPSCVQMLDTLMQVDSGLLFPLFCMAHEGDSAGIGRRENLAHQRVYNSAFAAGECLPPTRCSEFLSTDLPGLTGISAGIY